MLRRITQTPGILPQGSISGPLLFLSDVNDMLQAMECNLLLDAVDTLLFFTDKNVDVRSEQ